MVFFWAAAAMAEDLKLRLAALASALEVEREVNILCFY